MGFMSTKQQVYLVRHGETEWTITRQHTGKTDIPLTEKGEANALKIGRYLEKNSFADILTSPRQRARRTAELAGFGQAKVENDLMEWDYGDYEGLTTEEIRQKAPHWNIFKDGCPHGESLDQIGQRADRLIKKVRAIKGNVLLFSHGHFLRVFGARWTGLSAEQGKCLLLNPSSLSILSYEHDVNEPVIQLWNDLQMIM
jgi:broad specificity phosphatase PhoE